MSAEQRYEIETVVRRPIRRLWLVAAVAAMALIGWWVHVPELAVVPFFALPLALAMNVSARARVVASAEGLRVASRLVPRAELENPMLQHDGDDTYVALRGRTNIDVLVPNNLEADALVRALGLDAASTTVEVPLTRSPSPLAYALSAAFGVASLACVGMMPTGPAKAVAALTGVLGAFVTIWLASRVSLRIGADGLAIARPLQRRRFIPHDAITSVRREDDAVVIAVGEREKLVLRVPGLPRGSDDTTEQQRRLARRADEAQAIVRRIVEADRAFREHSAAPEALAQVLQRGERTAREWLDELRRIGEGAAGTFRTMGVARAQLFELVESTTATARDRIAAAIALRAQLTEDEKPRIRVAAERCAQEDLREAMLRVVEAEDDDAIAEEIERLDR